MTRAMKKLAIGRRLMYLVVFVVRLFRLSPNLRSEDFEDIEFLTREKKVPLVPREELLDRLILLAIERLLRGK